MKLTMGLGCLGGLLGVSASAWAQDVFVVQDDAVIEASADRPFGAGAPSVVHVSQRGLFMMFFEERTSAPGCSEAWNIGLATSPDGVAFEVTGVIIEPDPTDPSLVCGARNPAAAALDDGRVFLFFDGIDANGVPTVTTQKVYPRQSRRHHQKALDGLSEISVARLEGSWIVVGADAQGDLVIARSPDLRTWAYDLEPAIAVGDTPWSSDLLHSPSVGCTDATDYPLWMYFGGYAGSDTGWSMGSADATGEWVVRESLQHGTDASVWHDYEVLRAGGDAQVWYVTEDARGMPRIGTARSGPLEPGLIGDRDCRPPQ